MEIGRRYLWLGAFPLLWALCVVDSAPDGINIYKDLLRGKNDDDYTGMFGEDESGGSRMFFYRTPITAYSDLGLGDAFGKRTMNKYKNLMLNKEASMEEADPTKESTRFFFPRIAPKRTPGAILSWAIPAANRVRVINTNYRPPGINRPAA